MQIKYNTIQYNTSAVISVCSKVCIRPEDDYSVSQNMSLMQCILNGTHALNFEITERYGQYKYKIIYFAYVMVSAVLHTSLDWFHYKILCIT
jgi:hypothetical protein